MEVHRERYITQCLFQLRLSQGFGDRLTYCLGLAMTPNPQDWALLPLPAWLSAAYYVLRPIRLVGTYGLPRLRKR